MRTTSVSQKRGPVAPRSLPRARQIIRKHLLIEVPEREAYCFTDSVVGDDDDDNDGGNSIDYFVLMLLSECPVDAFISSLQQF